jgi:hypothetical protein
VVPGGDFIGIFHGAEQFEAYLALTLPAKRKFIARQQRSFMHQAMFIMGHAVNAAVWNQLSRPMLPSQNRLPLSYVCPGKGTRHIKEF